MNDKTDTSFFIGIITLLLKLQGVILKYNVIMNKASVFHSNKHSNQK